MSFARMSALGLLLVFAVSISACCGGGTTKVEPAPVNVSATPTLGQQLESLEAAYKKGAISKEEYETAKKNLIDQGAQNK
ncbi:MAG TPA: SHOCT domain-containing protein [Syntrophorhabdales bacterium]|nr:SHOCT domain-containing protein [Syntrophorhabdales bacterium]